MKHPWQWKGQWINTGAVLGTYNTAVLPAPFFRKEFFCAPEHSRAVLRLCGLGYHRLYVNGLKADPDRVLAPVVTQYDKRISYIDYDITSLLRRGMNALGIVLGNGWYNCSTAEVWNYEKAPWRDHPKLVCELYLDDQLFLCSDSSWRWNRGPVVFDALRNGEIYDARLEFKGFSEAGFDDSGWSAARICLPPPGLSFEESTIPCRKIQEIVPVRCFTSETGKTLYDFGTNLTGWCRITVTGKAGTEVTLRYGEKLDGHNDLDCSIISRYVKSGPFQCDTYILKGDGSESREPEFTYHGFRYVEVSFSEAVSHFELSGVFIHTALESKGDFSASLPELEKLHKITRHTFLCNHTGIPTDCPHREKIGWSGDAHLALETGCWNWDMEKPALHYLQMLLDGQRPSGQLSAIAPNAGWGYNWGSGPSYDISIFEIPYTLYCFYNSRQGIRMAYDHCRRYLDFCRPLEENGLPAFGLGDWCHPEDDYLCPVRLIAGAFYSRMLRLMAFFAELLGKSADQARYTSAAAAVTGRWRQEFLKEDGSCAGDPMTAPGAALYFEMFASKKEAQRIAGHLRQKARECGHTSWFGIMGAKFVPRMLAEHGFIEDALKFFIQPEYPGWGHWIRQGAETLRETWDGRDSQNHIMFGDCSAWMYRYLGGLSPLPEAPGFKMVRIRPGFPPQLDHVEVKYRSRKGAIISSWQRDAGVISGRVQLPRGVTGILELPGKKAEKITGKVSYHCS